MTAVGSGKHEKLDRLAFRVKSLACPAVFLLLGGGAFVTSSLSLVDTFFYSLWTAVLFWFLCDLVLARGLLQKKILCCKSLVFFFIASLFISSITEGAFPFYLKAGLGFLFYFGLFLFDRQGTEDTLRYSGKGVPGRMRRRAPLKFFFNTLFRLFPDPERVGLYTLGNPGNGSAIVVTGNYSLTVRKVIGALKGMDCYLLVCDSRGINLWCASLGGHFETGAVIREIEQAGLKEKVPHSRIYLPQLCAAAISLEELKESTGFDGFFGPVRIEDFKEFLEKPQNLEVRKVTFPVKERILLSASTLLIPMTLLFFVFNFLGLPMLPPILFALYPLAALNALTWPYRPVKNPVHWALVCASGLFALLFGLFHLVLGMEIWVYTITIPVTALYFICEFEGWSPLVKFAMDSSYRKVKIKIDDTLCRGCGRCVQVCPKGVYRIAGNKARIQAPDECVSCKSCIFQCPVKAVRHSAEGINESFV